MFWDRFYLLCKLTEKSPNSVCKELGFSNATATKWKNGSTPKGASLKKIADYFKVSADYLLTGENTDGGMLFTINRDTLMQAVEEAVKNIEKEKPQPSDDRWLRYEAQIRELPAESQERLMKQFQKMIEVEKELSQNQ